MDQRAPDLLMRVRTATLKGSGRSNQDAIVVTRRAAAVLDGASSWLAQPDGRDGGWYARNLARCMERSLDSTRPIHEIVADAIASVRDEFDLVPGRSPESTVTIARWDNDSMEVYALCDSPAVMIDRDRTAIEVLDDRLEAIGRRERTRYRQHLTAGHGYGPELDSLLADLQRLEHRSRNRSHGYWVAEAVPEAALHGLHRSMAIAHVEAVLLLSDGASAGVAQYEHPGDWLQAWDQIRIGGAGRFLGAVHELEATDPEGRRWPRAKPHDDKSIAVISPE